MVKSIKKILIYTVIVFLLSVFAASNPGIKFETRHGLPLLYKLRNATAPPVAPDNIFILTPYKSRKVGQPDELRDWDRRKHADIISKLSSLGVTVIAMDIYFRDPHPLEDDVLAHEIKKAGNVILNQLARPIQFESNKLKGHILRNPTEPLSSSTKVLAPIPVLPEQTRVDAIYSFHQVSYDQNQHRCYGYLNDADLPEGVIDHYGKDLGLKMVASLPVAALEQYLIKRDMPNIGSAGPVTTLLADLNQSNCEQIADLRKSIANNPKMMKQLANAYVDDVSLKSWWMLINQISLESLRIKRQPSFNLNFYGPAMTLNTLSYDEFRDAFEQISVNSSSNPFESSIVFIGGSFTDPADQKMDDFNTVFNKGELQMSGVEIAATAFANLYHHNFLTRHDRAEALFATLLVCLCIALISFVVSNKQFIVVSLTIVAGYSLFCAYQFTDQYFWPPFIIPILAVAQITLYELFDRFYLTSRVKSKLEENLNLYLSSTVANQVVGDKEFELEKAICLVTDVAGFTAISETLAPEKLHALNRDYFKLLFNCVSEHGADVIKTYGDSLTAIWKIKTQTSYEQAVRAGLEILEKVEIFNSQNRATPFHTRIGMSSGQIVIGYVGSDTHRTVELTGNAVYTASRLEQLNKKTKTNLLATSEFKSRVHGLSANSIGIKKLRGKSGVTDIIEIISINT